MASPKNMVIPALGRPFTLGMLYDARKEKTVSGISLWDQQTVMKNKENTPKPYSEFKISSSDSLEDKSKMLNVEASLKASFLGGLISLEGAAKYLNDSKKSKNHCRVTLQYKATTTFSHLSLTRLEAASMGNIDNVIGLATHVVTGIEYGANAFFVFDSKRLESNQVQEIQGSMEAVIKKIPKLEVEGKVSGELTEKEKELLATFSCKFYGDFLLDSNPTTFDEAVKIYQQLSLKLSEKNSVPVKVWLTPLKNFDSNVNQLIHEICPGLLKKVEDALEELRDTEIRCRDSLQETVVGKFPQIKDKLERFEGLCSVYTDYLQKTMKEIFPLIREGKEDDSKVEKLFDDKAPFSHGKLGTWMHDKEIEITTIKVCGDSDPDKLQKMDRWMDADMKEKDIISCMSHLNKKILASCAEHTLCFVFTSLESADPYLDELDKRLHTHELHNTSNVSASKPNQWYLSNEVIFKMKEKAQIFQEMVKALKNSSKFNFLIAAIENPKYKGATIYHYKGINVATEDFSKPDIPPVETVTDKEDLIWYARELTLNPDTANGYLSLSEDNKKVTCGPWKYYDKLERFGGENYQVLCREGLSGRSYWEVEWSEAAYLGVGVAYKGILRKPSDERSRLGFSDMSWYFGRNEELCAYHNGVKVWSGPIPPSGCSKIGVYLDWSGGTLTFYKVASHRLEHLHTFHAKFTEALYPGFYIYYKGNFAYLCPVAR